MKMSIEPLTCWEAANTLLMIDLEQARIEWKTPISKNVLVGGYEKNEWKKLVRSISINLADDCKGEILGTLPIDDSRYRKSNAFQDMAFNKLIASDTVTNWAIASWPHNIFNAFISVIESENPTLLIHKKSMIDFDFVLKLDGWTVWLASNFLNGLHTTRDRWRTDIPYLKYEYVNYTGALLENSVKSGAVKHSLFDREIYIQPIEAIKWAEQKQLPYIPRELLKIIEPNETLSSSTHGKSKNDMALCQAIAKTLWHIYPDMRANEIITHHALLEFGNGKYYKGKNTLRDWIREFDPRPSENKTGPKKSKP